MTKESAEGVRTLFHSTLTGYLTLVGIRGRQYFNGFIRVFFAELFI